MIFASGSAVLTGTIVLMARAPVAAALVSVVFAGCLWERNVDRRMARLQMGANARRIAMPAPEPATPATRFMARTTTPTDPEPNTEGSSGVTGTMQFTMRQTKNIYAGGEIEAGPFQRPGSYFGAAYAVLGFETRSSAGSVSVEMIAGRQWLRYEHNAPDIPVTVFEPRARAQLSVSDQVSLGAVIGAGLAGDAGWMAGLYLGVYSDIVGAMK